VRDKGSEAYKLVKPVEAAQHDSSEDEDYQKR
jgi:hypothetical protein